jgi:acyl carrier protein
MNEATLRSELKPLISGIIEVDDFNDDDDFVTQLGADSMMALEMVAGIEKHYRIRIDENYFPEMKTLNDIVRILLQIMQPANY